ncbi:MAG: DUF5678 domain-containing protein [archaeon]
MNKDSRFFMKEDFSKHVGKWVAIKNEKIIASNLSIKKTLSKAKKEVGSTDFLFVKIPTKSQALIL